MRFGEEEAREIPITITSHSKRHYVGYPLRPPEFPMEPAPEPNNDVLYGVAQCEKGLSNPATSPTMNAVYLSYLIHLIGDMHQPLHCCSLFDNDHLKGRQLAIDKTYSNGQLKRSLKPDDAPELQEGYTKEAKAVAAIEKVNPLFLQKQSLFDSHLFFWFD